VEVEVGPGVGLNCAVEVTGVEVGPGVRVCSPGVREGTPGVCGVAVGAVALGEAGSVLVAEGVAVAELVRRGVRVGGGV
jgi:hypothetical protein